jgi:hypothetical protein
MRYDAVKGRSRRATRAALLASCLVSIGIAAPLAAQEGPSEEDIAQANNPLAGAYALNLQNYYASPLYGVPDRSTNTFWMRAAVPIGRTLTRASLPLATRPSSSSESAAGLGDFNIFTAYLFVSNPTTSIGVGPLLVAPTATDDALGQGKWQAGAAAVAFKATPLVQFGGLLTWQGSFAGDSDRESTSIMAAQPFAVWQLGGGTYLRSTGVWTFDLKSGDYAVPIGFGIGQVIKQGKIVYNIFLEPQFSILHEGTGQPKVQLFAGLNLQFPRG